MDKPTSDNELFQANTSKRSKKSAYMLFEASIDELKEAYFQNRNDHSLKKNVNLSITSNIKKSEP